MSSFISRVIHIPSNNVGGTGLNFSLTTRAAINLYRSLPRERGDLPFAVCMIFGATKVAKFELRWLFVGISSVSATHVLILS